MAKQFAGLDKSLFAQVDPYGDGASAAIPASVQDLAQGGTVILPLAQVRPDPNQPRHVLPPDIAHSFERAGNAAEALDAWAQLGRDGDAAAAASYAELESLANSIAADGLIQPITVIPVQDGQYHIESGERRWWAHQLLNRLGRAPRGGAVGQIEVIVRSVAPQDTLIRQLAENLHRQDLCAVETAVGLAAFIAEIEGQGPSGTTVPLSPQARLVALREVAAKRRKEGTWSEVAQRLGKSRRHWEHYLAVLNLCDDALDLALRHRLTERSLREVTTEPDPQRQITLMKAAIKRLKEQGQDSRTPPKPGDQAEPGGDVAFHRKFVSGLRSLSRAFQALDGGQVNRRALVKELLADEHFDEIAATARQVLPVLEAVLKAQPGRKDK